MLMKDGAVRNAYTLRLRNMEARPRNMEIALAGLPAGSVIWTDAIGRAEAAPTQTVEVPANETKIVRAYVIIPEGATASDFAFELTSLDEQQEFDSEDVTFAMPGDI